MREIKFRGKAILFESRPWVYGHVVKRDIDTGRVFIREYSVENVPPRYTDYEVDPATVGLYTGIDDEDGVEIYEGDILIVPDYSRGIALTYKQPTTEIVVKYNQKKASWNSCIWFPGRKVIGNIHEPQRP